MRNTSHEWTRLCSYFPFTLFVPVLVAAYIFKHLKYFILIIKIINFRQPWPNGLASRRNFSTAFRLTIHLRGLALTCDNLHWIWSSWNSYVIRRTFLIVWLPNASRLQVDHESTVYARNVRAFFRPRSVHSRPRTKFFSVRTGQGIARAIAFIVGCVIKTNKTKKAFKRQSPTLEAYSKCS